MDMSVSGGSILSRVTSTRGYTAISHFFVMDWASIWVDIAGGLLIAGALAAWVPDIVLAVVLPGRPPVLAKVWGPLVGPLVAIAVVRLLDRERAARRRAVERRDQLRRRGRLHLRRPDRAADPEHLPEVLRAADGAWYLFVTFYVTMVGGRVRRRDRLRPAGAHPDERDAKVVEASIHLNYTTVLNVLFLVLAAVLVVRFLRTGGPAMLRMMGGRARPRATSTTLGRSRSQPAGRPQTIRRSVAQRVSWCRFDSCSLRSTDDTWVSTVFTDRCSSPATSLYV